MTGVVASALGLFAGTNVDDLIVLSVLFLAGRSAGAPRPWQVWTGQAIGFALLVAVSALAALGLVFVPDRFVRLLGLIPLCFGLVGLARAWSAGGSGTASPPATGVASVIGLTVANGADNLAVYPAVFRTASPEAAVVTVAVFAVCVAVWCLLGSWLGSHRRVIALLERSGRWLVPAVFFTIGAVILAT